MRRPPWWLPGLALVLVGGAMVLTGGAGLGDAGPFTYDRPMTTDLDRLMPSDDPSSMLMAVIVTRAQLKGTAVVVLGLMVLAATWGFRLGRRRTAPQAQ